MPNTKLTKTCERCGRSYIYHTKQQRHCSDECRLLSLPTLDERFLAKVEPQPNGCLLWTGGMCRGGYGQLWAIDRMRKATHVAWFRHYGYWPPPGIQLHHRCETPACCEWSHLEALIPKEHSDRHPERGPATAARQRAKTHCKHGHEYTPENTYWWHGERQCRSCWKERQKELHARKVAAPGYKPHCKDRTECPRGHPYSPENTIITKRGSRRCRACSVAWTREYRLLKKGQR